MMATILQTRFSNVFSSMKSFVFLAATKQLYEWYFLSVCPSVTPFWLCSHHRITMKFSGVITKDQVRSMQKVKVKGQGHRSPIWIHIWWWNDTHSLMNCLREVPYCLSRSSVKFQGHTALKIIKFDPYWAFPDWYSSLNSPMGTKCFTKLEVAQKRCPIIFQGHPLNFKVTRLKKIVDFDQNWVFPDCNSSWNSLMAVKWCTKLEAT